MRKPLGLAVALALFAPPAFGAARLDVSTGYKLRALGYQNMHISDPVQNKSFMTQNARLGFAVRDIELTGGAGPEPVTMDVALSLRAIGVAGSTGPILPPFDVAAQRYPNAEFLPFIENAYLRTHGLLGYPMDLTIGQQPYSIGSGLLLSDDGAGLAGIAVRGSLPWWDLKADGYVLQPRNHQLLGDSLTIFGASLELPSEGTWQLHQMFERELAQARAAGLPIGRATRSFTSVRYLINFGPLFFDGEAAIQRGSANPSGPAPAPTHITYQGNAQVMRAKWKQPFFKGEGIGRLTAARGSGDAGGTPTTDEAFFPSFGHRYDGLERSGMGDFFQATPYDAFGGQSTATASGLPQGASGIIAVGFGFTPPAYKGIQFDLDFWLFQADRNNGPHRTLGREYDLRARYGFRDRFSITAGAAIFQAGPALSGTNPTSRRYTLEFSGRF
ncbi:MAG: hypothetical protein HY553_09355 [Elusimicrobia bacterium]|nr:hypothetical protein [Elusimicrobiota bacterium]